MPSIPAPINSSVETLDEILHSLFYGVGVELAITALSGKFSFLKLPIISTIFAFIVKKIADALYQPLEQMIAFKIIEGQVNGQVKDYQEAVQKLNDAHTGGDPNAILKAKEDAKAALKKLIHIDGG